MKKSFAAIIPPGYLGTPGWAIESVAELEEPLESGGHPVNDRTRYDPKLALLHNAKGNKVLWFTYWWADSGTGGEWQWEGGLPLIKESAFLELVKSAIKQGFFSEGFLIQLNQELESKLG